MKSRVNVHLRNYEAGGRTEGGLSGNFARRGRKEYMEEKKLLKFLGNKKRLPDIYSCRGMINRWRALFPEYEVNTELEATDIYLRILIDIRLNERRAFDDAVKRMKLPFDLG